MGGRTDGRTFLIICRVDSLLKNRTNYTLYDPEISSNLGFSKNRRKKPKFEENECLLWLIFEIFIMYGVMLSLIIR